MVSDSELISRLQEIIRTSDLDTTSAASVRRKLEAEFGVSLNDKKAFIREQINSFLDAQFSRNDNIDSQPQLPQEKCQGNEENTCDDDADKEVAESEAMDVDGNDDNGSVKNDDEESDKENPIKNSEKVGKAVKRKRGGFAKLSALSPQLQKLVGVPELARNEVVKKIWAYIKEKDLQVPSNKKKIKCDKILRGIFQVDTVDMFKMNKLLSKHIWPVEKDEHQGEERGEENEESVADNNVEKQLNSNASEVEGNDDDGSEDDEKENKVEDDEKENEEEDDEKESEEEDDEKENEEEEAESDKEILKNNSETAGKVVKRKGGGFAKLSALSPQLQELVGVPELARTEVVKRIWAYIKEKDLQVPSNKRKIKCDKILRGIFKVDTIDMFKMNKSLSKHIWPIEKDEYQDEEGEEEKEESVSDNVEKQVNSEASEVDGNDDDGSEDDEKENKEEEAESDKDILKNNSECKKVIKRKGGFSKPSALSPQLQELVGVPELARTEVVKKIWAHIREKNLQDPNNRKKIKCDKILRAIFQVDTVDMFKMHQKLSKHIWPIEEDELPTPVKSSGTGKLKKRARQEDEDEPKVKVKRQKGQNSGLLAPLPLSDSLVKFLGTGEDSLSRSEVVKRMWQYIKENELQDPTDRRRILCDDKFKELFEVDSFNGFSITKLLTAHFIKRE